MEQVLEQAANYGFPMVVTVYLRVRIEGRLEKLTASINDLARTIAARM